MIRSDLGARKHLSKSPNDHSAFPVRNEYKTAETIFHGARLQDTEEPNRETRLSIVAIWTNILYFSFRLDHSHLRTKKINIVREK